jgi:hypothetical protein
MLTTLGQRTHQNILSAVSSLKDVLSIITALTLTNTLVLLVTERTYDHIKELSTLEASSWVYSLLLIVTLIRFYHGNIRHLDDAYWLSYTSFDFLRASTPPGGLGIDFVVVFGQSILLAVTSFYAGPRPEFFFYSLPCLLLMRFGAYLPRDKLMTSTALSTNVIGCSTTLAI